MVHSWCEVCTPLLIFHHLPTVNRRHIFCTKFMDGFQTDSRSTNSFTLFPQFVSLFFAGSHRWVSIAGAFMSSLTQFVRLYLGPRKCLFPTGSFSICLLTPVHVMHGAPVSINRFSSPRPIFFPAAISVSLTIPCH